MKGGGTRSGGGGAGRRWAAVLLWAVAGWLMTGTGDARAAEGGGRGTGHETVNLQGRLGDVAIERDGTRVWVNHGGERLTAEAYLLRLERAQRRRAEAGVAYRMLNITTAAGVVWVAVGLLGQVLFTGRMVVQWWASEREGRSVVPAVFWWMSLGGATMLLIYFVWRKDIVGVLGQGAGWAIYARNLVLIWRTRAEARAGAAPARG
ncbi:MAG: lipid-A-disaccharide synthase N-terminal domain-containing protein [Planctomycetota bacterium]